MDDALLDVLHGRIDGDNALPEEATDLLLAACQGDGALAEAVGVSRCPRHNSTAFEAASEVRVEIVARKPDGFTDHTVRTVTENVPIDVRHISR